MANVKLSKEKVIIIKQMLNRGWTHKNIASQFGVSRQTITKINKSIKHPYHKNARWSYIDEFDSSIVSESYLSLELRDIIKSLTNEKAGSLIKALIEKMEK